MPPPGYVPSLFLTPASPPCPTQGRGQPISIYPVSGTMPARQRHFPCSASKDLQPKSNDLKLIGVFDVVAPQSQGRHQRKNEIPPKIPPKPPFIRRKQLSLSSKKNDYANCVCQSGDIGARAPVVERALKPKLAAKHMNPSLPNLGKLCTDDPPSSTNPFRPDYCSSSSNPFAQSSNKSAYRLGEEFFASLFPSEVRKFEKPTNKQDAKEIECNKTVRFSSDKLSFDCKREPRPINHTHLTRLPTLTTNMSLADPIPSQPPAGAASSGAAPAAGGQPASTKKDREEMDKYAALKNLDDIFRTSVAVQEGETWHS